MKENDLLLAKEIAQKVKALNGRAYFVGGYVRDYLLGIESKDIDIEIHGIKKEQLLTILANFGGELSYGSNFKVYNVKGYGLDISLPRSALNSEIEDPFVGEEVAAKRRDFSINALMMDVLSGEILDYVNGVADLNKGIIRHNDTETFVSDRLRVLRAAQLAARLNFKIDDETIKLCQQLDISDLPQERVFEEAKKALLKANKPSIFFEYLLEMGQLNYWFEELAVLKTTPQNPRYHAEGDAFIHTMMVIDKAATLKDRCEHPFEYMMACLSHDVGKAITTEFIKDEIHSYLHEVKGVELAGNMVSRLTNNRYLKRYVESMTYLHMRPSQCYHEKVSVKTTNRLFDEAICPLDLVYVSLADSSGKLPLIEDYDERLNFLLERLAVYQENTKDELIKGVDLIELGVKPSKKMKEFLKKAHDLQLAGLNKEEILKEIKNELTKN